MGRLVFKVLSLNIVCVENIRPSVIIIVYIYFFFSKADNMMESFLEDAESSLHHRATGSDVSYSSDESDDFTDDPFLYDKFLPNPDYHEVHEEEKKARRKALVDPGLFRYNKRVFVTSVPALLFVLALGGET